MAGDTAVGAALKQLGGMRRVFAWLPTLVAANSGLPLSVRWDTLDIEDDDGLRVDIARLEVGVRDEPIVAGDVQFTYRNGVLQPGSRLAVREPFDLVLEPPDFQLDSDCLSLAWDDPNINRWLGHVSADLADRGDPRTTRLALRAIFGGPRKEVRLDWDVGEADRTYTLPGVSVTVPAKSRFSLVWASENGGTFNRLGLVLTVPRNATLHATSNFAWGREGERELQDDDSRAATDQPLIHVALDTKLREGFGDISVLLFDLPLGAGGAPRFFRQLATVAPISGVPCAPIDLSATQRLDGADWKGTLNLNLAGFRFPFLRNDEASKQQFLTLSVRDNTPLVLDFGDATASLPVDVTVQVGSLVLKTSFAFVFNWETFGLDIDHTDGLQFVKDDEEPITGEFLGLHWTFKGKQLTEGPNAGKHHFLTLATQHHNYQVQQAPGSEFTLEYTGISEEPLGFTISDFTLRPQGLSLKARVSETPVRLRGIDTKFRFSNSGFEMHDSRITEFTLAGSGALPPDLVGDSSVDIFLRFGEREGGLTLLDGTAALRGNKLLQCKGTRFEFSVDKLGISFVQEGRFHLYFTLSGSAQFRLADGDETEGLLSWLPEIKITMVDCPLAGDVRVLAKHLRFLVTLPKPLEFSLLGCFTMELRGFGFLPQADVFGGDPGMWISGQIKFADTDGDTKNDQVDFHSLYIGLPKPGEFVPRVHLEQIVVDVKIGGAFKLYAMVKFYDDDLIKGFAGEGKLMVSGLPSLEAAFSFVRVRTAPTEPFVRAWFIAAQATELSLMIPVVQIYIREIGFGLGYRYTLAMIKAADEERDVKKLLKALDNLAKSQGELAKLDSWRVDIGGPGDPRFTLVLRAMISQTSASSPTSLNRQAEKNLSCLFLFDATLAFRSDLTFLITARGWINTNYVDYADGGAAIRRNPFAFAYILLSPPQKRFLARMGTTPGGYIGDHPPLAPFMKQALAGVRFRATLLIEPGLFHLDLGWPNQLGWSGELGPIKVSITGGFIFRISRQDLVIGVSYMARGSMDIRAEVSAGIAGVRVSAHAEVAYGMRFIGVLSFDDPARKSLFYGAVGFELMIQFSIEFWINLLFKKFRLNLSLGIIYSAAIEFGLDGLTDPGVRGHGTLGVKVCGRTFRIDVKLAINEGAVEAALKRTEEYMKLGLDADDSGGPPEPVPGTGGGVLGASNLVARRAERLAGRALLPAPRARRVGVLGGEAADVVDAPHAPHYSLLAAHDTHKSNNGWRFAVIFPRGAHAPGDPDTSEAERGFLPVPPAGDGPDFSVTFGPDTLPAGFTIEHWDPSTGKFEALDNGSFTWRANWQAEVPIDPGAADQRVPLSALVESAFVGDGDALRDPDDFGALERAPLEDDRVHNPSPSDFEAAVRGAYAQFSGSPFFKHDPSLAYDAALQAAFRPNTTIYADGGAAPADTQDEAAGAEKHADQLRGLLVNAIVADLQAYAEAPGEARQRAIEARSLAFQMGLVFRFQGKAPWLESGERENVKRPVLRQRMGPGGTLAGAEDRTVWAFNPPHTSFAETPPAFGRVRHYANASTIAIAWDLVWEVAPAGTNGEQADPEHHLAHYRVLRRALDGDERDVVYSVKSAEVLHRERPEGQDADVLTLLKPRFQIVDHFTRETPAEQAALPQEGRSYLYTITPIDVGGKPGRPLTLVATRFPDRPPRVPTDAQLRVRYRFDADTFATAPKPAFAAPTLLLPNSVTVRWSEPPAGHDETRVPVDGYKLLFRRSALLPVGSYALDSTTQRGASTLIGSAVARPLPTDIVIDLPDPVSDGEDRSVAVLLDALRDAGVFPRGEAPAWRPDSWDVFIQAIALNGVPSSLAPVQLVLEADTAALADKPAERQPAELEWLPAPHALPLLPPEDQRATVGDAHFPMPLVVDTDGALTSPFDITLANVQHMKHPAGIRTVRLRWNDGPSAHDDYPLDLTAGFHLLELDIDAATTDTFADPALLAQALRTLQEVRMAPAGDLPFLPGDTLASSQWEAWYPSAMQRRTDVSGVSGREPPQRPRGSQVPRTPWYSWRESLLEWPDPHVAGEPSWRRGLMHPLLQRIVDRLDGVLYRVVGGPSLFAALNAGTLPEAIRKVDGVLTLTAEATVRVVTPGVEWRIEDPKNTTVLYKGGEQQVFARQLRVRKIDTGVEVSVVSPYTVDLQEQPPAQQGTFEDWLAATPPKADPYGWGVLQLLGLSVTLALRDSRTARPILGGALLRVLHESLDACLNLERFTPGGNLDYFRKHLFVEALFQPNRAVELNDQNATPDALLAQVQLSLRPTIRQLRPYAGFEVRGAASTIVELSLELEDGQRCDMVVADAPGAGQQTFVGQGGTPAVVSVPIPPSGVAVIALRGDNAGAPRLPGIGVPVAIPAGFALPAALAPFFELKVEPGKTRLLVRPALPQGEKERRLLYGQLADALKALDPPAALLLADLSYPRAFAATDERSTAFLAPQGAIKDGLEASLATPNRSDDDPFTAQWLRFKAYVDNIYTAAATKIVAPATANDIDKQLPDFFSWSQRFFDASAPMGVAGSPAVGSLASGPWLATAYPRASTPAYATPDASGRLKYDHLLQDPWAHAFRYYLKPYGRYERLMAALRDAVSPAGTGLPAAARGLIAEPAVDGGGLDVVVERVAPLAAPLVLRSGRLGELGRPDQPAPPGRTWEVIVAQHPEQRLSERNQTARRRLAFRQIAFTLLRRFAEPEWLDWLHNYHTGREHTPFSLKFVENVKPDIPRKYPPQPDHIDLQALRADETGLSDEVREQHAAERRSLDLPQRLGRFQQGAIALQWDGLPFYYEHRLLLFAQADSKASPLSDVTQRDFEYRSPPAVGDARGAILQMGGDIAGGPEVRARRAIIHVQRLWDSLPASAQSQWSSEDPGEAPYGLSRPFASLPDRDVTYQIVEVFSGNAEVQAELFFGTPPTPEGAAPAKPGFIGRQLGKRVLATLPPAFEHVQQAEGDYRLETTLVQRAEVTLSANYDQVANTPVLSMDGKVLRVAGVFTHAMRDALLDFVVEADKAVIEQLHDTWYGDEPVSHVVLPSQPPAHVPADARAALARITEEKLVDFPAAASLRLVWSGPIQPAQRDLILALGSDDEFKAALARLVRAAEAAQAALRTREPTSAPADVKPAAHPPELGFVEDSIGTLTALIWAGPISETQASELPLITEDEGLRRALTRLAKSAQAAQAALLARDAAPRSVDQLPFAVIDAGAPDPQTAGLRVTRDPAAKRYTALGWLGPCSDAERGPVETELAKGAPVAAFRDALDRLFATLDTRVIVRTGRARPAQGDLPESVRANLLIDEGQQQLRWSGPRPTQEQADAIRAILADQAFANALQTLLAHLLALVDFAAPVTIPEGAEPPPIPDALAPVLQLSGDGAERQLLWSGQLPDAAQQAALDALASDAVLGAGVADLFAQFEARRKVGLPAAPQPFSLGQLPAILADQLRVTDENGATTLRWFGPLRSAAQLGLLAQIVAQLGPQYRALAPALEALIAELSAPVSVTLDLPERPRQPDLDGAIRDRLLLGRFVLRYHGLMTFEEGQALSWLYVDPPAQPTTDLHAQPRTADTRAVQQLYAASLMRGMRGRELRLRTRRANAAAGEACALEAEELMG